MTSSAPSVSYEQLLHEEVARYYADPLGFVLAMFPWEAKGTALEHHSGPDTWQTGFLERLEAAVTANGFDGATAVAPIRMAVSKGHGVGGSALAGMVTAWIMSTRPYAKGTVTANTMTQLETKTWAAVRQWAGLCRTGHWFEINTQRMYRKGLDPITKIPFSATWYCNPASCAEENSEAFAGQHNVTSTSFYINDEDSNVSNKIHEVSEGGLTDGEPMQFLFGNPTRSSGAFYQACFGSKRHRYDVTVVDSRTSRFTNQALIAEWAADWGEESDFFRVRVLGLPPNASDAQFIDQRRVTEAQKRQVVVMPDEPLVAGCDLAWGGSDYNVIRFRRGRDARSIPAIRIPGEFTRDPSVLVNRLSDVLSQEYEGRRVSMLFLDSAGIAGAVGTRLRELGFRNVLEVNFGSDSPNPKRRYMRDHMWAQMKDWLLTAAIDVTPRLESDLVGPGLRPDSKQRIWLESKQDMKKRGIDSPDDGDALALTFAQTVKVARERPQPRLPCVAPGSSMAWGV